jgi:hypothetical protein
MLGLFWLLTGYFGLSGLFWLFVTIIPKKSKFVKNAAATCPLCGTEDEDLCHFILVCTKLSRIRKRHLQKIEDYLEKIHKGFYIRIVNENKLLQVIID